MRAHVLLVVLVSGCSLYFAPAPASDDGPPPDSRPASDSRVYDVYPSDAYPPPDRDPPGELMARCEDGVVYAVAGSQLPDQPGHGAGRVVGRCGGACRSAAARCASAGCGDAVQTLCSAPPSPGATCPLEGAACLGPIECPETTACSLAVPGSACGCVNGTYHCMQVTAAAATQARIVGKWRGTVTPPGFARPYPITLWLYPDGSYWAECEQQACTAFYYGGDGPTPRRKITILSTSDTVGSWADIAIDFGFAPANLGALSALVVDDTTLRFTFSAAWLSCGQPFDFVLARY